MRFVNEDTVAALISSLANGSKGWLVELTKVLNNGAGAHAVDAFMDAVRGRGHRIVFGHDISYLPEIFDKFGLGGVKQYFVHLSKDVMSPDGIPLPFAHEIQQALGLSHGQAINWLCLNIGDIVAGGFSVWHTTRVLKMLQEGNLSKGTALMILITASPKIAFSLANPNPIGLASGITDLALLTYYAYPVISNIVSNFFQKVVDCLREVIAAVRHTSILCFLCFLRFLRYRYS